MKMMNPDAWISIILVSSVPLLLLGFIIVMIICAAGGNCECPS